MHEDSSGTGAQFLRSLIQSRQTGLCGVQSDQAVDGQMSDQWIRIDGPWKHCVVNGDRSGRKMLESTQPMDRLHAHARIRILQSFDEFVVSCIRQFCCPIGDGAQRMFAQARIACQIQQGRVRFLGAKLLQGEDCCHAHGKFGFGRRQLFQATGEFRFVASTQDGTLSIQPDRMAG